jgi:hypothetical protein
VLCRDRVSAKKLVPRMQCVRKLHIVEITWEMFFWTPRGPGVQPISRKKDAPATMKILEAMGNG